jgi:hypothetical protein
VSTLRLLLRLWPLWLALATLALGWYARGVHDAAGQLERQQEAQRQASGTNRQESAQQQAGEEVSRDITDSIHRGGPGARISPYLECLLRAVDERRPAAHCMPDRVRSPAVSLGSIADGAGRSPAERVQDPR